jgi:hypothetical protein
VQGVTLTLIDTPGLHPAGPEHRPNAAALRAVAAAHRSHRPDLVVYVDRWAGAAARPGARAGAAAGGGSFERRRAQGPSAAARDLGRARGPPAGSAALRDCGVGPARRARGRRVAWVEPGCGGRRPLSETAAGWSGGRPSGRGAASASSLVKGPAKPHQTPVKPRPQV